MNKDVRALGVFAMLGGAIAIVIYSLGGDPWPIMAVAAILALLAIASRN